MADEQMNPAPSGGRSNTMWYVIGAIVVLLLIGAYVMRGVGSMAMRGVAGANGVTVQQGANGATTYTNGEGSVTVGGGSMPSNWPSDAPQNYSGATISYSGESNPQTGKAGAAVVYTVHASAQAVVDYYKSELSKNGWTVAGSVNTGAATALSATKDTRGFGVYIVDAGGGNVSVTAGLDTK